MPFFTRKKDKPKEKNNDKIRPPDIQGAIGSDPFGENAMPQALLLRTYYQMYHSDSSDPADINLTTSSRLSKTLQELLHDRDALPYLTQFLKLHGDEALIRFWLDAESFQASAVTRTRSHSQISQSKSCSKNEAVPSTKDPVSNQNETSQKCTLAQTAQPTSDSYQNTAEDLSSKIGQCSLGNDSMQKKDTAIPFIGHSKTAQSSTTDSGPSQGVVNKTHAVAAPIVSNSSAHGGTSGSIISLSPPRASPCEAATSDLESGSQLRPTAKGEEVIQQKHKNTTTSQKNNNTSAIHTPNHPSGDSPQSIHNENGGKVDDNSIKGQNRTQCQDENTSAISIKTNPALTSQSGASVIQASAPSSEQTAQLTNESEGRSCQKQGASKPTLQDKLLSNIASDAVRIFSRYIAQDATHPIGVTDEIRQECISKICREDGLVDPHSFVPCQEYAVQELQNKYYTDFMASVQHCQHQIDLLTSSTVLLSDVLYNDTAMSYFTEFMELENAMSLLQCWMDLENFQKFLLASRPDADWTETQNDAMVIYDKYFSLQARQPLGFEDKVRFEVEVNICREGGPLPDCFTKPKSIVTAALNKAYFPQYLQSELYFKYLSDLINTVQLAQDLPHAPLKRKESDTVSQHSGHSEHTANTLLAGGRKLTTATPTKPNTDHPTSTEPTQGTVGKAISKLEPDMQIDNALLINPDTLWQRPMSSSLSLARIDEMGRFVSDFETQPDQEKGAFAELGIFKRGKEKDKAQQDMALQVANRIIADITGTTQPTMTLQDTFRSEPVPK